MVSRARIILLLAVAGIILASGLRTAQAAGGLNCGINTTCTGISIPVVYLKNDTGGYTNAHVQNVSVATYPYSICCNATTGSLGYNCAQATVLKLNDTTNSHAQWGNYTGPGAVYTVSSCLSASPGTVQCIWGLSCGSSYECLGSMASSESGDQNMTNSHVGPCSEYPTKICCKVEGLPNLWFTLPASNSSVTSSNWIFVNVSADKALSACKLEWYNGTWTNVTMSVGGAYCYLNMTGLTTGSYYFRAYGNDTVGNWNVTEDRGATVSLIQQQITRIISPSLLVARENETVNSTTFIKYTNGENDIYMVNITSEVPWDFAAPSAGNVRVYFNDYSPYGRRDITGNSSVSVSVVDQAGTLPTLVMVNISSLWLTDAGGNMSVNDSIEVFYLMNSSQMAPNDYRTAYTNSTLKDNQSYTGSASILSRINSSEIVLRGDKKITTPDAANPQIFGVEISMKAIGGPVSGILLSDYLPQGASISGLNVTYYNQSTGVTKNLVNGSDYYVATPKQASLSDGSYVDVYYYNFSYKYANWDGNLYDNDTITIKYNATVLGGGQWVLPAIISGYDPTYKTNIKTETSAPINVPLFDVIVETITKSVKPGDIVKAALRMLNVGGPRAQVDVFNTYSIKSMTGQLIVEKSETFAVLDQKEKELDLQTPSVMPPGMYTFETLVTYTGREAMSTDTFEVTGSQIQATGGGSDNTLIYVVIGAVVVIAVAAMFIKRKPAPHVIPPPSG